MLWDIIRDFFVVNIFGGVTSTHAVYSCMLGNFALTENDYIVTDNLTSNLYILYPNDVFYNYVDGTTFNAISFGDYLSTTFTIITFVLLFIVAVLAVRWCFRVFNRSWKWF